MDRGNQEGLRRYEPDVQGRGYPDYGEDYRYEDSWDYRSHSPLDVNADLRRQHEHCEGTWRSEHRGAQQSSYENGRYEPRSELYGCAYDEDVRESDYQQGSRYTKRHDERRYSHGDDHKDCGHAGWDIGHDDFRQSHDSDFYEDRRQSAAMGREPYSRDLHDSARRAGESSQHGLLPGGSSDCDNEQTRFLGRHGRSENYPRGGKESHCPDRGYMAGGGRRLIRADSDADYVRGYRQHQVDRHHTLERCAEPFDTYEGTLGEKYRMDEKHTRAEVDFSYHRSVRPNVDAVDDHDELSYHNFIDYSHVGIRNEDYRGYCTEGNLAQMRRDRGPSDFRQRSTDEKVLHRRSPSPEEQRRRADSYESEYVYRNRAYEDDDKYHQECYSDGEDKSRKRLRDDMSHDQLARQERSSSGEEDRLSFDEQRDSVDSLPHGSLERHANQRYKSEQAGEDHQGLYCANADSELMPRSAHQHAGKNMLKHIPIIPPVMQEISTTMQKRAPLTATTFSPGGEVSGDLLDIPQHTESSSQQHVRPRRRAESLMTQGSQRFATMKNARRIAEKMGMEEATADALAEVEQAKELLEEYGGRVKRTSWARRNQLQRSPAQEGDKFDAWDLKSFKAMKKASELGRDVTTWLTMWSSALKTIEGHFGTGVVSYFLFLRWLLLLNLLVFLMPVLFIITPHSILPTVFEPNETRPSTSDSPSALTKPSVLAFSAVGPATTSLPLTSDSLMDDAWVAKNRNLETLQRCYQEYHEQVAGQTKGGISQLQDFLQGTGWMELTALFSGRYLNSVDHIAGTRLGYNFPLAYVLTNVACFALCLLLMVRYTTAGVREALLVSEGKLHRYCNMVFASWDFCITDERTARLKHVSIVQELKSDLAEERRTAEIASWSRRKKVGLFVVRLLVNLFVIAVILGSLVGVYNATSFSFQRQSQAQNAHQTLALVIQFVPSLVITGLNLIVPAIFSKLIRLENYSVAFQVKLTLLRTVFLRFTSIFVLLLSLYKQISCTPVREENCLEGEAECRKPMCWETAVGQQIYKLTILDFIVGVALVFVVECPRKLIVTRCQCKLAKMIGQQEFNIPNRVLDLVYSQTLCWLGTFYCPLLPAVTMIKYFIIFYVQKFTLMSNSAPSQTPYRASRSNTFFVIVLLLALFLAVIPFAYALVEIQPSLSCGPFQKYLFTWEVVPELIYSWRDHRWGWYVVKAIDFMTSVAFGVPVVVVLAISIYYYYSVSAAHSHMEKVLKDKLVLEGKDKQFLLARITEVARQRPSSTA